MPPHILSLIFIFSCFLITLLLHILYKPPYLLVNYFQHRWPDILWHVPTSKKLIALTIDDGPSQYTNEILQILKANNTNATFFIIGCQVFSHAETLQDIIRNGNELANHAMWDEPSRTLTDAELTAQIQAVDNKIRDAYTGQGKVPPQNYYFRPGSGFFSTRMRKVVTKLGYRLVLGSIYPHDAQIPFWRVNARHIKSMLRPGGIIICHDRRSWTAPMLRKVLPEIKRRGYCVVTVTELLEAGKS